MKIFVSLLAFALLTPLTSATAQEPAPAKAGPRPTRVRAKLEGFDIAPQAGRAANQTGGASRGIGGITLYAPRVGKAYSLTPTFSWSAGEQNTADPVEVVFTLAPSTPGSEPLYKTTLTASHLTYPADAPKLEAGKTYTWTVTPVIDMMGSPASARITMVPNEERSAIEAAVAHEKTATPAAQAKLFASRRLWYDAVQAYSDLIAAHPGQTDLLRSRAELYDSLPQTHSLADADLEAAQH